MTSREIPIIEEGIPITKSIAPRVGKNMDVIKAMKVGDSVLLDDQNHYMCFYAAAKRLGVKVASRQQQDGKVRLWRVK